MTRWFEHEIKPGAVVWIDASTILDFPGVESNAPDVIRDNLGKGGPRPFLVLDIMQDGRWLCVDLYSKTGPLRGVLDNTFKRGDSKWVLKVSHYHTRTGWLLTMIAINEGSACDATLVGRRWSYAPDERDILDEIATGILGSDIPFSPVLPPRMERREILLPEPLPRPPSDYRPKGKQDIKKEVTMPKSQPIPTALPVPVLARKPRVVHSYDEDMAKSLSRLLKDASEAQIPLPGDAKRANRNLTDLVADNQEHITTLRKRGVTWAEVAYLFGKCGAATSGDSLRKIFYRL